MGLKQIFYVDMEPIAAPQMYLCPKLDENVLMAEAVRYTKAGEEIPQGQIADGAQFTVAPGQCLLLTKGGQITEVCAQPGVYLYNRAQPASFLMGTMTRMTTNQPEQPQDGPEQVIYLNGEEYGANAFTCPEKLTFQNDEGEPVSLMCRGRYCYRIANPILFYNYAAGGTDRASLGEFLLEQFLTVLLGHGGIGITLFLTERHGLSIYLQIIHGFAADGFHLGFFFRHLLCLLAHGLLTDEKTIKDTLKNQLFLPGLCVDGAKSLLYLRTVFKTDLCENAAGIGSFLRAGTETL